jgi:NADH:ubiquinone oxidoreductase subunit K
VSVRAYGWYLAAFATLIAAGACIGVAGVTFLRSLTPLYLSLVLSIAAIVLAVIAWRRFPKGERG